MLEFFDTSTRNLLAAEAAAGVGHHVALSVVGTERLSESGYFRAKLAQEKLIKDSSIPYSIVHATQFFEFLDRIAAPATDGNTVRLPPALIQPIAADDVAGALGRVAVGRAGERHRRDRRARAVPARRARPRTPRRQRRSARGDRRPGGGLLRRSRRASGASSPATTRTIAHNRFEDWLEQANTRESSLLKRGELVLEASHRVAVQQRSPAHPGHAQRGQLGERRRLRQAYDVHRAADLRDEAAQRVRLPQGDRVHAVGAGLEVGVRAPQRFGNELLLGPGAGAGEERDRGRRRPGR